MIGATVEESNVCQLMLPRFCSPYIVVAPAKSS